jgi:hypothetical protein
MNEEPEKSSHNVSEYTEVEGISKVTEVVSTLADERLEMRRELGKRKNQ